MEFNEIMTNILRILDMLDKIYHAVVKEEPNDGSDCIRDPEQE